MSRKIQVALVTRIGIEGDYEYARNLYEQINHDHPDIGVTLVSAPFSVPFLRQTVKDYDVVHFNFIYGFPITEPGVISSFNSKRVVLTFHENNPLDNFDTHRFLRECARVVVHEKNKYGFDFIPQAIPVVEPCLWSLLNSAIGTAGFPFADKQIPKIADAGRILISQNGCINGMNIVAPDTAHANTWEVRKIVTSLVPTANYVTDFLPQDKVLAILSKNLVNVYTPSSRRLGPSGSVRLGLATGSHMVLNRSAMFRDLFEYEDEIEFIEGEPTQITSQDIADAVLRVIGNLKRPKRVLEDGSLKRCASLYADVYRSCL